MTGITLEPAQPEDQAFILDSWLRSYEPPNLKGSERARYYRNERVVAERAVRYGRCIVAVIAAPGSHLLERQLAGWIAGLGSVVHFVYVKNILRGNGIGTALVDELLGGAQECWYDHMTPQWRGLLRSLQVGGRQWTQSTSPSGSSFSPRSSSGSI